MDRNLPTLAGKGYVFNGLTHDSYVVEYQEKADCMSHDTYETIIEKPWSVKSITLREALTGIKNDLGENAVIDFDRDIATIASCKCGCKKNCICRYTDERADARCPECGETMQFD